MMIQLGDAQPYRIASFVNLDGVPYASIVPDVAEHNRTKMMAERRRRAGSSTAAARRTTSASRARSRSSPSGGPG